MMMMMIEKSDIKHPNQELSEIRYATESLQDIFNSYA